MRRETLYVFDTDYVPAVVSDNICDAEHYRRLFKTGYRQVVFGVREDANGYLFHTFSEDLAEKVAQEHGGELIYVDWKRVPFSLNRPMSPCMVLLPLQAGSVGLTVEAVKVTKVDAETAQVEVLRPLIDSILHRIGVAEVDFTGKLPYPFRIGHYGIRPTRYESGVYVAMDTAGIPVVAFGKHHIALRESKVTPAPNAYAPAYTLPTLMGMLIYEWNRFGGAIVLPYPADDAVMAYENTDGNFVNLVASDFYRTDQDFLRKGNLMPCATLTNYR